MADAGADEPADRRIHYRIGLNLGDVIVEGDDLDGDGVNVAARLQQFAPPGGIALPAQTLMSAGDRSSAMMAVRVAASSFEKPSKSARPLKDSPVMRSIDATLR